MWFDAGAQAAGRLLLTIHHLAVDGVSWRILVPELAAAWEAIAQRAGGRRWRRGEPRFAAGRSGLPRMRALADRVAELAFWRGMLGAPSLSLVEGALDPERDINGTAGRLTLTLPAALTGALLTRVPAAFHGGINDVLLTGLGGGDCGLVPAAWPRVGQPRCCSIWRDTGARRCSRMSTCRARWGGSPACSRCGSTPARSMSMMRWRAAARLGARSRASRNSCGRCPTTGSAMGCCVI